MIVPLNQQTELGKLIANTSMEKPKSDDIKKLDAYLAEHGDKEIARIGDLSRVVATNLINNGVGTSHGFAIAVTAHVVELIEGLGYADAAPLEKLLIDNIALCWIRLHDIEIRFEELRKGSPTINQVDHWERRLTLAQHRYIKAIESLAKVRRLLKEPQSPLVAVMLRQQLGIVNKGR